MSEHWIRISNLSLKANEFNLKTMFSLIGPVLKLEIFDDPNGVHCADLMFEMEEFALKAVEDFNGKEILKKTANVQILKDQTNFQNQIDLKLDKETIGEMVYPIALEFYPILAPKITGMIVQSALNASHVRPVHEILATLNSIQNIVDLVLGIKHFSI